MIQRNRLTEYTKGGVATPFTYDKAGNLLKDNKAEYTYDAFNRTEKVETFDGHVQINRYDAEGLRHELEEDGKLVQFIFRGDEAATEEKDSNIIRFIRGYDLIASDAENARTYYHYASDEMSKITHVVTGEEMECGEEPQQNSQTALSDKADAVVLNHYEYDAWGNTTVCEETVENRFRFNGQQLDPITQQYYLRARFYNPVIARFTQEDTYRGDGLNLYAYCKNNPVYYVDPSGHLSECMKDAYLKAREDGMSKEDAYAYAKKVYEQNHAANSKPTVEVPNAQGMTKEQWKDAYRDARLENKPVNDLLRQIHDVEKRTGMRIPNVQMEMLIKNQNVYAKLPFSSQRDAHRKMFDQRKPKIIRQWEQETGKKWPTYTNSKQSAKGKGYIFKKGWKYDAHEIIPNAYGGPIEWWNIVPVHRDNHQSGIHTEGSVHYLAYPDLYN